MKAKILATCLTVFALVGQSAYALPKASGAGASLTVSESKIDNKVDIKDSERATVCAPGVGVCNLSNKTVSGAGASIEVKNSRITNEVRVSGSKNSTTCAPGVGVCNMDAKK